MDQSDARSKRQNAASPIGNVCGDRPPERGEAFRSAPWRPSGQRLEREDRAAAGRGQRGRRAAVGLVDRMQVDVVRILVVWMIVEMHLDLVALADADELAGHMAAEGPEGVADAVGEPSHDFPHFEMHDDLGGMVAMDRRGTFGASSTASSEPTIGSARFSSGEAP